MNWICPAPLHPPTVTFTTVVPSAEAAAFNPVWSAVIVVVYPPVVALVSVLPVATLSAPVESTIRSVPARVKLLKY
ncbi:hypothetical protein DPMN_190299 [Dreissena polymorpha]|uniref:Uncharacterized protein n=1 Tax=Dreissena polymorpha TaxID=45954 RepID=A0A9D4DUE5_DREPO|nr:hypothetical protein DPMN_190299 [Dreissena polymorpha]